ncbi:MAG: hypothetical protein KAT34_09900 [Candidatus Aminicenantes bacterium]|nr:hypothetical protein [Candidatus Aminicenantes bacterium]
MEDVKKYILSLAEVGLYKARVEEDGKELIFADNKFEERMLPGKTGTFDETEELLVIDLEKEQKLEREKKSREKKVVRKAEIEEEPESYRVSPTKKWFRAAIFVIPIIAAAVIFLLTNPPGKEKIDLNPQKTGSGTPVIKVEDDTPAETDRGLTDKQPGELTEGDITGEEAGESQGTETERAGSGEVSGKPGDDSVDNQTTESEGEKITDKLPGETTGPEIKTGETDMQPVKTPVGPGTKIPTIQTVKIVKLQKDLIREYNTELSKLVIPFIPVKIKVTGYLNVKISVNEKGKTSAKILSSEGLKVTPEGRRENVLNLIIKKISSLKLTPPKDKRGKPVRVSWFNIDYQAGKLRTRLILKKR